MTLPQQHDMDLGLGDELLMTIGGEDAVSARPAQEEQGNGVGLGLGGKGIGIGRDPPEDAERPSLLTRRRAATGEGEVGPGLGKGPVIRLDLAFSAAQSTAAPTHLAPAGNIAATAVCVWVRVPVCGCVRDIGVAPVECVCVVGACVRACACACACVRVRACAWVHSYIHTKHTNMHTCICRYISTYIYTCR